MGFLDITPYQVIQDMLCNQYNQDKEFVNTLYKNIHHAKLKIVCQYWSYDWIVDIVRFDPVLKAMSKMSKIYFAFLSFRIKHPEIANYIKNIILLLKNGIVKYGCKNPPYIIKDYNMSEKDLIAYGNLICSYEF